MKVNTHYLKLSFGEIQKMVHDFSNSDIYDKNEGLIICLVGEDQRTYLYMTTNSEDIPQSKLVIQYFDFFHNLNNMDSSKRFRYISNLSHRIKRDIHLFKIFYKRKATILLPSDSLVI